MLWLLLTIHPALLTRDELVREMLGEGDDPDGSKRDAVERAIRHLAGAGLLNVSGELMIPSRTVLEFDRLELG
ncbi:MAG TPA: hypothetical protein VH391_08150 [Solirubrobacterales bacterium]